MNPDDELLYSRSYIEGLESRVASAEELCASSEARRAALEILLIEAREVAVMNRNERVNGDSYECGRDVDPLPWEREFDCDVLVDVSDSIEDTVVPWVSEEDEL